MESDTKFLVVRHVPGVRTELNSASGLPFEEILSADVVASAITEQGVDYRKRFFLPTSRSGHFYRK